MFSFYFAIYGEMLTYGFLEKETRVRCPRYRLFGNAHLGVDFFFAKKSTPFDHLMPFVFTLWTFGFLIWFLRKMKF